MKRILFTTIALILCVFAYSQTKPTIPIEVSKWLPQELAKVKAKVPIDFNSTKFFNKGTAKLIGCIKGYNTSLGFTTGLVYLSNELTREDFPTVVQIQPNGRFEANLPYDFPKYSTLYFNDIAIPFYLEPGQTLSMILDSEEFLNAYRMRNFRYEIKNVVYQGPLAKVNTDLAGYTPEDYNYEEFRNKKKTMTPDEFKIDQMTVFQTNKQKVEDYILNNNLTPQAINILRAKTMLENAGHLLDFVMERRYSASQDTSNEILKIPVLSTYFDFLKDIPLNDNSLLCTNEFSNFVNRFEYCEPFLLAKVQMNLNNLKPEKDFITFLLESGAAASAEDKELAALMQKDTKTEEEKQVFDNKKDQIQAFLDKNKNQIQAYSDKYVSTLSKANLTNSFEETWRAKDSILHSELGLESSLVYEITKIRDLKYIFGESPRESANKFWINLKKGITTPYLIETGNKLYKESFPEKTVAAYTLPKGIATDIFKKIIDPFKGKLLFIDFWATTCGPCVAGIKSMKPNRAKYKGNKDFDFIFITDESGSPEADYTKFVKEQGMKNTYRLPKDDYNYLRQLFKFNGIPHYTVIDQQGNVLSNRFAMHNFEYELPKLLPDYKNIQNKPDLIKTSELEHITGNWFRSDNAQWEISLFDSVAVYKSQVWKCGMYTEKEGLGTIALKNGDKTLTIYTKKLTDNTCMIGENAELLVKYTNQPNESVVPVDNEAYQLPIHKMDSVTYCGYIKGFSASAPQKTGMVYVNNVLTGEQDTYLLKVEDDGTFKVKFPLSSPMGIYASNPNSFEIVYVEPGKTIFHLVDNDNKINPVLFMGDCARLNTDMIKLKNINSFDNNPLPDEIIGFSPEQYKTWCKDLQLKDLNAVANFAKTHSVCAKALQQKNWAIDYRYARNILEYGSKLESAYRKKNNISYNQNEIPFKPVELDSTYFTYLTNELVNNQIALLSPDYYEFIGKIMSLNIIADNYKGFPASKIIEEMEKSGCNLTSEEKELTTGMKEIDSPEFIKAQDKYQVKYGKRYNEFYGKYYDQLQALSKEKNGSIITPVMMEEYLIGHKVEFTEEDKAVLVAAKEFNDNPLVQNMNLFYTKYEKQVKQFYTDHNQALNELYSTYRQEAKYDKIHTILGINPGLATELMTSQDFYHSLLANMTPYSDDRIKAFQQKITTPFIASYIEQRNNETKSMIEANKKLKGSIVNEVPNTTPDKLFDTIMAKYKGKVVYVDFWATWCAPCRSGISQIQPLKGEMANENVAFVYISNQTSPKTSYDNMIPTIKGEHYRVSNDQWTELCSKFNITGIPHYVLVGKDGKVIDPHLGHLENPELKALLMKSITE